VNERRFESSVRRLGGGLAVALCLGASAAPARAQSPTNEPTRWQGWLQFGGAYTFGEPEHWSQARVRGEIAGRGTLGGGVK